MSDFLERIRRQVEAELRARTKWIGTFDRIDMGDHLKFVLRENRHVKGK